jgi:Ca-activated chloride channel family protein
VLGDLSGSLSGIAIRPWEFLNYYGFDYPVPADGDLALHAAMVPVEGQEAQYRMQLGIASETMTAAERPAVNLTLVLDTSGSMAGHSMNMLKESCRAMLANLREGDTVSMVVWAQDNAVILAGFPVEGPDDETVLAAIDALGANGGTNLSAGLEKGYELAQAVWDPDAVNRLVLISDGGANVGLTDENLIAENAAFAGADGIYLVGVGVGTSNYNDALMDTVTDVGKGASVYVHDAEEAWKVFSADFVNTIVLAAREVQVQMTMPGGFEVVSFSGEEIGGDPQEIEPQHLAPNDTMVFHQVLETCAPEGVTPESAITVRLTWQDVWTFEEHTTERTWTFAEMMGEDQDMLLKGHAVFAYAQGLAAYKGGEAEAFAEATAAIDAARGALPQDADLIEIQAIVSALD